MTVTFPHFGHLCIAMSKMLDYIGIKYIVPLENDGEALKKGMEISPEEICLPFKYMAGNFKKAYELGADTAIMMATNGPCRLGEYCKLLKDVLDKDGCSFRWILLDTPSATGIKEFIGRIKLISSESKGGTGTIRFIRGVVFAVKLINRTDRFRSMIMQKAGYLETPAEAVKLHRDTMAQLSAARGFNECFRIIKNARKKFVKFSYREGADPVKILVTGEIYTSVESAANGRIEEMLAGMGCSVKRHIDISWWIRYTLKTAVLPEKISRLLIPEGAVKNNIGGYGRETAAKIINDRWSDGIIKIMPAGCMPEIVTKAFCENIQQYSDVRILHLVYDEMQGSAGYETRIEAFVDMLERRKHVLAGDRYRLHQHRFGSGE